MFKISYHDKHQCYMSFKIIEAKTLNYCIVNNKLKFNSYQLSAKINVGN